MQNSELTQKDMRKLQKAQTLITATENAQERFALKPFAQEFSAIKTLAGMMIVVCSLISITTAVGFLYYKLLDNVGFYGSVAIALIALTMLEYAKNKIFDLAFLRVYAYGFGTLELVLIIIACALLAVSIATSLLGAKETYLHVDKRVATASNLHQTKTDSLQKSYAKQVAQEREDLNNFRKSVTWNGQINIYDNNVTKNINAYQNRIDLLQKKEVAILKTADSAHTQYKNETAKDAGYNVNFWIYFSACVELTLLICAWFLVYYDYRTAKEPKELFKANRLQDAFTKLANFVPIAISQHLPQGLPQGLQQTQHLPIPRLARLAQKRRFQSANNEKQDLQDLPTKRQIGFNRDQELSQDLPKDLREFPTLEAALRAGITDTRLLSKMYKVNFVTIAKVRKQLTN